MNDEDLDDSWIQEQEKIQNIQHNYSREPMEMIAISFILINQNNYIDKIVFQHHELEPDSLGVGSQFPKESLLKIIQNTKAEYNFKYKLDEILLYNIDIDPENIQSFSKMDDLNEYSKTFFKVIPIPDTIQVSPSIFIFHKINMIYLLFKEFCQDNRRTLKSILKAPDLSGSQKSTKKVRINESRVENRSILKRHKKTIKIRQTT
jgi:hypothetical protein